MRRALLVVALVAAAPALAQDRIPVEQRPGFSPAGQWCRDNGRHFDQGEATCLRTPQGGRVAECRMEINMMSWRITERPCAIP